MAVFKLPLHHGIVDVRQDDQLIEVLPHTPQTRLFRQSSAARCGLLRHQVADPQLLRLNVFDLFLSVLGENLPGFLEALVRELFEGHFWGLLQR